MQSTLNIYLKERFGECACGGGIEREAAGSDSFGPVLRVMSGSKRAGLTLFNQLPALFKAWRTNGPNSPLCFLLPHHTSLVPGVAFCCALCGLRGLIVALKRLQANYETLRGAHAEMLSLPNMFTAGAVHGIRWCLLG